MTNGGGSTSCINQINKMPMVLPMIYMVNMNLSFYNGYDCKIKRLLYFWFWKGQQTKLNVSDEQFEEFEFIIHLYLDFCQKEKVI